MPQPVPAVAPAAGFQPAVSPAVPGSTRPPSGYLGPQSAISAAPPTGLTHQVPVDNTPAGQDRRARAAEKFEKARETEYKAQGCLYTLVDLLDTVGSILPSALGGSALRNWSQRIYSGQRSVEQAKMAPSQAIRTASYVKNQASEALPSSSSGGAASYDRPQPPPSAPTGIAQGPDPYFQSPPAAPTVDRGGADPVRPAPPPPRRRGGKRRPKTTPLDSWSQTPTLEPTEAVMVDLLVMPKNPYHKQDYDFTVMSTSIEQENAPLLKEDGVAHIKGISWFWRYIPRLVVLLLATGLIIVVISMALWRADGD